MAAKENIAVIGAGLGGLSAAIRLAAAGFNVHVFEKNECPGGKAGEIRSNGFRFDSGPSLLTMPFIIERLFIDAGERIEEFLEVKRPDTICKYFWSDGTVLNAYSDLNKFASEVESITSDSAAQVTKYLNYARQIYDLTSDIFLFNSFSIKSLLSISVLKKLKYFSKIDPFRTMHEANSKYFNDAKTIQLFDRYATYNGSNPYQAPATLNIIQHVEYNLGAYVLTGGMYALTEAVMKLAIKKKVEFHFGCGVDKIVLSNNSVKGIITQDGTELPFSRIISNADSDYTYKKLLRNQHGIKKRKNSEPSTSALVFYWGIKGIHNTLDTHNILFSDDYKKEFDELYTRKQYPADPTVYIYISSKFNRDDAPEGMENWFVMINTPFLTEENRNVSINKIKSVIIDKIKIHLNINVEGIIVFERVMTPEYIEKITSSAYGSIYGSSSNSRGAAFNRHKNNCSIKGLYFCGGSVHPGGGIPLVLLSGKIASDMIIKGER